MITHTDNSQKLQIKYLNTINIFEWKAFIVFLSNAKCTFSMEMFNEKYAFRRKYQTNEVFLHDIIEAGTFCWNLHHVLSRMNLMCVCWVLSAMNLALKLFYRDRSNVHFILLFLQKTEIRCYALLLGVLWIISVCSNTYCLIK